MKVIIQTDENGYYKNDVVVNNDNPKYPEFYTEVRLPVDYKGNQLPFYKPQWNGDKWEESLTQDEMQQIEEDRAMQELKQIEREQNQQRVNESPVRVDMLEVENAELWYKNMVTEFKLEDTQTEVALLWYELMMGGI